MAPIRQIVTASVRRQGLPPSTVVPTAVSRLPPAATRALASWGNGAIATAIVLGKPARRAFNPIATATASGSSRSRHRVGVLPAESNLRLRAACASRKPVNADHHPDRRRRRSKSRLVPVSDSRAADFLAGCVLRAAAASLIDRGAEESELMGQDVANAFGEIGCETILLI